MIVLGKNFNIFLIIDNVKKKLSLQEKHGTSLKDSFLLKQNSLHPGYQEQVCPGFDFCRHKNLRGKLQVMVNPVPGFLKSDPVCIHQKQGL